MSEKKRDAGYRAALTGAKGTVRLLIYVCVILVIILAAKTSYQFGHDVFAEEPVASRGKGKEVTVQVRSGMEAKELGELLKDNGLIDESILVFEVRQCAAGWRCHRIPFCSKRRNRTIHKRMREYLYELTHNDGVLPHRSSDWRRCYHQH